MFFRIQVEGVWDKLRMGMYLELSQTIKEVFYVMIVYHESSAKALNKISAKSLYKILVKPYGQGMQLCL